MTCRPEDTIQRCQFCDREFMAVWQYGTVPMSEGWWRPIFCERCQGEHDEIRASLRVAGVDKPRELPFAKIVGRSFWRRVRRWILND